MLTSNSKMKIWTPGAQQRYFNFFMGVILPVLCAFSIGRFILFEPNPIVRFVFFSCLATCLASSTALGSHCIFPVTGKRFWTQLFVRAGVVLWAPIAFFVCLLTAMLALVCSLLMAGLIKLGLKAIMPLRADGSRFTLKQVFWLTTLIAVLSAALAPLIRSMNDPRDLLRFIELFIDLSTPVLAAVTFSTVSLDLKQ